jgi:hypothetical protein
MLSAWSPAGNATGGVVEPLGGRASLEEVGYWGCAFEGYILFLALSSLSL